MLARPTPPEEVLCVGIGGPPACRWTAGRRARLYSEFEVFTRYRQTNVRGVGSRQGVVRSFTLATRWRSGFVRIVHRYGDQYAGWPADYFTHGRRLLAAQTTLARYRAIVAPLAAGLTREEEATGCTGRG
jgi:hypothetical protein